MWISRVYTRRSGNDRQSFYGQCIKTGFTARNLQNPSSFKSYSASQLCNCPMFEERSWPIHVSWGLLYPFRRQLIKSPLVAPTPLSRSKQHHFHLMAFAAEMDKTQIKNRQRGAPLRRLNPKIQTIKNNTVHFGFSKFSSDSRLPLKYFANLETLACFQKQLGLSACSCLFKLSHF